MHQALSSTWPSFNGSPSYSVHGRPNAYSTGSSATKGTGQGARSGASAGPGASPSLAKDTDAFPFGDSCGQESCPPQIRILPLFGQMLVDAWRLVFPVARAAAPAGTQLVAKNGSKLAQQIARWHEVGGQGGAKEFLQYAGRMADEARSAGNAVTGTVGRGAGALENATIYRRGAEYLVTQGNAVMSYVSQASPGGIVDEFVRLGGAL